MWVIHKQNALNGCQWSISSAPSIKAGVMGKNSHLMHFIVDDKFEVISDNKGEEPTEIRLTVNLPITIDCMLIN